MKRTQIQLDQATFEVIRHQAFRERRSMASVIRTILQERTLPKTRVKRYTSKSFSFVGSGLSHGRGSGKISEQHDEEFAKASSL